MLLVSPHDESMSETKKPDERWVEYGLTAFGAVGTILGLGTWLGARFDILLAFVAGGGWAFVIALLVLGARTRKEINRLEIEVTDLRRQTQEWRSIALNDSTTLNNFVMRAFPEPRARARQMPAARVSDEIDQPREE